jgi:hypothetical protein
MLHGGPASVAWFISVNSSEANYKTPRAECNRRNEIFLKQKNPPEQFTFRRTTRTKMKQICAAGCGGFHDGF